MLIYGNRSIWPSKTLRGKLTLLRVLRASCAARRAGSALAKSSSQSLCFPLTTTAMAATLRSSSSATAFSLDTFSVSIPTTWGQQIRFIWPYYTKKTHQLQSRQFGNVAKLKLVHSRCRSNIPFIFGSLHNTEKSKLNTIHMPDPP